MGRIDEAMAALDNPDWTGAEVVRDQRPASTVYSVRLPDAVAKPFEDIATARGITPTKLLRELVDHAIASQGAETQVVTLNVEDLHRALDAVIVQVKTREAA